MQRTFVANKKLSYFLMLPLLLVSGCCRQMVVTHNSYADAHSIPYGFPFASSFYIAPVDGNFTLLAKEIRYKIEKMLFSKGYKVSDPLHADYCLTFEVSTEQTTYKQTIAHTVPGQKKKIQGHVDTGDRLVEYEQEVQLPDSVAYEPYEYTCYTNEMIIRVYNAKQYRANKEKDFVWEGSALHETRENDIRESIDYLLLTSMRYFGKNTYKKMQSSLSYESDEVKQLRGL